jgi:hypothetical protein
MRSYGEGVGAAGEEGVDRGCVWFRCQWCVTQRGIADGEDGVRSTRLGLNDWQHFHINRA